MELFKKKKPAPPPPCNHKYKDFPWYMDYKESYRQVEIVEPYVCIKCHERKNVVLQRFYVPNRKSEADALFEKINKTFKDQIKDQALVEDMVNDMIYVDRGYLDTYEAMAGSLQQKANVLADELLAEAQKL